MIILSTAIFAHVLGKQGLSWTGAGAAWLIAAVLDTVLFIFLIDRIFGG